MSARDEILGSVRAALHGVPTESGKVDRDYRSHGDYPAGHPALVELLSHRLVDYRAVVRRGRPPTSPTWSQTY